MKRNLTLILILIFLLTSCSLLQKEPDPSELYTPTPVPTNTPLPEPRVMITEVPDPTLAAEAFLKAWQEENYVDMYNMLCQVSRDSVDFEYFQKRYNDTAVAMTLKSLGYEITSALTGPNSSQVAFHVTFDTVLAGTLGRDNLMDLVLEAGTWKVQWQDTMIMPELEPGNRLVMDIQVPTRGTIYDRNGVALAYQTRAYAPSSARIDGEDRGWNPDGSSQNLEGDALKNYYLNKYSPVFTQGTNLTLSCGLSFGF